jgi:two-component system, chemotaxis family, chemotaxis protein CheY
MEGDASRPPHPTMAKRSPAATPDPACPLILVVDDDPDHVEIARRILEGAGYLVEHASDGGAALARLLLDPPPDLIVVDLLMPVMNGWQLVTELRQRPPLAKIPVVVVSAAGERVLFTAPVSAGYLTKPLDADRLLETIAVSLARRGRLPSGSRPINR